MYSSGAVLRVCRFSMVNDTVSGTQIPGRDGVYGDLPRGRASFRTEDDVRCQCRQSRRRFSYVRDSRDVIKQVYKSGRNKKELHPFDMPVGKICRATNCTFPAAQYSTYKKRRPLSWCFMPRAVSVPESVQRLLDRKNAVFEYYSSRAGRELRPALAGSKNLLFYKSAIFPGL